MIDRYPFVTGLSPEIGYRNVLWARDPEAMGQAKQRKERPIYELFQEAARDPQGPQLLIRASRTTQRRVEDEAGSAPLWDLLPA
jgi:hypothetical protein